jgi:transposase
MGRAYAQDLRERVMAVVDSGTGAYAAAAIFRASVSYIYKALGRRKKTGEMSARPWAGGPKPKLAAYDEALRACVMSEPDATLAEPQAWLMAKHSLKVSIGCLWKRPRHLWLTLKKSHCAPPNKTAPISSMLAKSGVHSSPI